MNIATKVSPGTNEVEPPSVPAEPPPPQEPKTPEQKGRERAKKIADGLNKLDRENPNYKVPY